MMELVDMLRLERNASRCAGSSPVPGTLLFVYTLLEMMYHVPVMVQQVIDHLPDRCINIVDGTLWHGWHTLQILKHIYNHHWECHVYGFDRDAEMISKAKTQLDHYLEDITFVHDSYQHLHTCIADWSIPQPCMILLDLWVNNDHFVQDYRWFSIQYEGPLDMRFDTRQYLTAADIIRDYSAWDLTDIFVKYGWFTPYQVKACVDQIIHVRIYQQITTTTQLKEICLWSHIHFSKLPALFQSLRIQVNQEMNHLETFLNHIQDYMHTGMRVMIMTYHSLEDRIVKYAFAHYVRQWYACLINKKVIKPHYTEQQHNKKSRSAKLRILEIL